MFRFLFYVYWMTCYDNGQCVQDKRTLRGSCSNGVERRNCSKGFAAEILGFSDEKVGIK